MDKERKKNSCSYSRSSSTSFSTFDPRPVPSLLPFNSASTKVVTETDNEYKGKEYIADLILELGVLL